MALVIPENRKHYVAPSDDRPDGFYWEDQAWFAEALTAERLLSETDFVVFKAMEAGETLSSGWKAWRESLRQVVRGMLDAIPDPVEPARYKVDA